MHGPLSVSIFYNHDQRTGERDGGYGAAGPSAVVHGHSGGGGGGAAGGAWDQYGSTSVVGRQGLGAKAGNRIRRPWDEGRRRSVPVYYHDEATAGGERGDGQIAQDTEKAEGTEEGEEQEEGEQEEEVKAGTEAEAEGGREQALEYVGCFRDHPGRLREYSGERSGAQETTRRKAGHDNSVADESDGMESPRRQQWEDQEGGDDVYVFPQSLTVNVRERLSI